MPQSLPPVVAVYRDMGLACANSILRTVGRQFFFFPNDLGHLQAHWGDGDLWPLVDADLAAHVAALTARGYTVALDPTLMRRWPWMQ